MTYDSFMGALCIFREARSCTITQMNCIWHVLNNRTADAKNRWPNFIADVVVQPMQFSSFNHDDPNSLLFPTRKKSIDFVAWKNCELVVDNPLGADPTNGANHYHSIPNGQKFPFWADEKKLTLELGPFKFYKL